MKHDQEKVHLTYWFINWLPNTETEQNSGNGKHYRFIGELRLIIRHCFIPAYKNSRSVGFTKYPRALT